MYIFINTYTRTHTHIHAHTHTHTGLAPGPNPLSPADEVPGAAEGGGRRRGPGCSTYVEEGERRGQVRVFVESVEERCVCVYV